MDICCRKNKMLPIALLLAISTQYSNPTLHRDAQRWMLARTELKHDIIDLKKRIDWLDRRIEEQLSKKRDKN